MHKRARCAFTLIEVMVAVMIISVVIAALIQMFANNTHIFSQLTKQAKINQYTSLFVSNRDYGLETKKIHLDALLSDFKLERDLAKEISDTKVKILYQKLEQIDMSESDNKESNSSMIFEIGKTVLKINDSSTALFRVRMK
ncbi:PilW family protein [Sulfurimonas sp. CS5]|uniref:PilW family protein n=1 Tax=Sulfurimonas sp. CS5 TaxID=3391145 RepID=UPI0039EAE5D3